MTRMPETARLRFRRLTPDDRDQLFEMFADPYARTFYPEMFDPENVRRWIEWNLRNYEEHGFGLWAVELKESGEFIGDCGLTYQNVAGTPELEIGYHIVQTQRRKGYALEAARACLDFGFQQTAAATICSIVRPANVASCTVAARLHADCRELIKGDQPILVFATTRAQWADRATTR